MEGLLSIVVAIPAKFLLADWPEQARRLSRKERMPLQLRNSQDVGGGARMDLLDSAAWRRILTDWKIAVGALVYMRITTSGYATAFFVPTVVSSLGYSGVESQVHGIPSGLLLLSSHLLHLSSRTGSAIGTALSCSV